MSGTIPLSMTQQFDIYGDPLDGGKLYTIVAGTVSTPQNSFQDAALLLPWPNPITLDATGRVPQFFLADGLIKIRLTDKNGVVQLVADNVQVVGASSGGGGGGGTVDPTTIYQTGDLKPRYGVGAHTGWVRCNGNTIGSSISGANERANADTQVLFQFLWGVDPNLTVSGGRGASALADWTANKQIALPDLRGRVIAGLDDMGAAAAGRLTAAIFGVSTILLGAAGGTEGGAITLAQLPAHQHDVFINDPTHDHDTTRNLAANQNFGGDGSAGAANASGPNAPHTRTDKVATGVRVKSTSAGAADDKTGVVGSGTALSNTQPTMLATIYIKL